MNSQKVSSLSTSLNTIRSLPEPTSTLENQNKNSIPTSTAKHKNMKTKLPSSDRINTNQEHMLAVQIVITDPESDGKNKDIKRLITPHKLPSGILVGRRVNEIKSEDQKPKVSSSHSKIQLEAIEGMMDDRRKEDSLQKKKFQYSTVNSVDKENQILMLKTNKLLFGWKPQKRSELIRDQHRPPWFKTNLHSLPSPISDSLSFRSNLYNSIKMPKHPSMLMMESNSRDRPTSLLKTTDHNSETNEFLKIISSAHSPINNKDNIDDKNNSNNNDTLLLTRYSPSNLANVHKRRNSTNNVDLITSANYYDDEGDDGNSVLPVIFKDLTPSRISATNSSANSLSLSPNYDRSYQSNRKMTTLMTNLDSTRTSTKTIKVPQPYRHPQSSLPKTTTTVKLNGEKVTSPSLMFSHDDDDDNLGDTDESGASDSSESGRFRDNLIVRAGPTRIPTISTSNTLVGGYHAKKTTVIYPATPPTVVLRLPQPSRPTRPPALQMLEDSVPQNIKIEESPAAMIVTSHTTSPPQLVKLISKQKSKYDDNVISSPLTVVDNDAIRLPLNATSVHNNKLIVALRPGRPLRKYATTTQFPIYNIVAGITPPYFPNPTPVPLSRPPASNDTVYGLLKPNSTSSAVNVTVSTFGAQNIKFPAADPPRATTSGMNIIDKFNVSLPESVNLIGPQKVPDKLVVESEEHEVRPPISDSIVVSGTTLVTRPIGTLSIHHEGDGIIRLSTTRKPPRDLTTRKINIVSSNTTVVTTDSDQLHEVLNILGSHNQVHHVHHTAKPSKPSRPTGFFATISNAMSTSVVTSVLAVLTLIKTIVVAILVMFLPPIALTAAVMQAISLG